MNWHALGRVAAVAVCVLAAAALAMSQAFVIHDAVAAHHGHWPVAAQWAMAVGFEAAIVAVGLAVAVTGFDFRMIVAEAFLLAPSVAIAADGLEPMATPGWLDTLAMSVMPLQYAVVILAAHRLAGHYAAMAAETDVAAATDPSTATDTAMADEPAPATAGHDRTWPAVTTPEERPRPAMTDGQREAAKRYAAMAGQVGDDVAVVADRVGKAKRTVRRWRADAQVLGILGTTWMRSDRRA